MKQVIEYMSDTLIFDKDNEKRRVERFATVAKDYVGVGVAAVILNKRGEVLLQKRGEKARNERGKWKLPGGEIEWGETMEEALRRELKEELGIEINILKFLFCLDDLLKDEGQHWVVPFYLCKVKKGVPKIMEEDKVEELTWFATDKLPKNLAFGTGKAIERLKEMRLK